MAKKKLGVMGVTCDGCDYRETEVSSDDFELYLNTPCPKCGTILVTEKDYQAALKLMKVIKFFETPIFHYIIKTFNNIFHGGRWGMAKVKADSRGMPRFEDVKPIDKSEITGV